MPRRKESGPRAAVAPHAQPAILHTRTLAERPGGFKRRFWPRLGTEGSAEDAKPSAALPFFICQLLNFKAALLGVVCAAVCRTDATRTGFTFQAGNAHRRKRLSGLRLHATGRRATWKEPFRNARIPLAKPHVLIVLSRLRAFGAQGANMSGLTVKYFMWSYQPHFQSSAERSARELFNHLLPELDTSLFLVGIKVCENEKRLPLCVEPDHCTVQPSAFETIEREFQKTLENDDRSKMIYSNPTAEKRVHERIRTQSMARAIEKCCAAAPGQQNRTFIASDPTRVEHYVVSCVLSFDRTACESQMVFADDIVDRMPVERSVIQAMAREFLDCCKDGLREEEPGVNLGVVKASSEELLRRGGQRFLNSVGWRAFGVGGLGNVDGLYDAMNAISAMHYEGSVATGKFILSGRHGTEKLTSGIRFVEPVSLRNSRRIRKLLELTHGESSLLVADDGVVGLVDGLGTQSGLSIAVRGHRNWCVLIGESAICEFRYGIPSLPKPRLEEHVFQELCCRILPKGADTAQLWRAADSCMKQSHGTMMVISSRAAVESQRLARQSTLIEPCNLTDWEVHAVSSIDGAILFNHAGMCCAIGVILDGLATAKGDPARGARYNSAVRYLSAHGDGCVILVVSEDGDVTLLPQLHPRISRRKVEDAVHSLSLLADETPFRQRVYAEALNALEGLRFYLSASQCEELNGIVQRVENRLGEEGRTVRVLRCEFVPVEGMNDSYWLEEEPV